MKRSVKKALPLILFFLLFLALAGGILSIFLTGQPEEITTTQLNEALLAEDLIPVDVTDSALEKFPGAGLLECIVAEKDGIHFEFYRFEDSPAALDVYQQAHRLLLNDRSRPRVEITEGRGGYRVHTLRASGKYSAAIYVGNTAVYVTCDAEKEGAVVRLLDAIGYIDASGSNELSLWMQVVVYLGFGAIFLLIAQAARQPFWHAAYRSAGVTLEELDEMELSRKERMAWVAQLPTCTRQTEVLLALYRWNLVPVVVLWGLIAAGNLFPQFVTVPGWVQLALPIWIIATAFAGIFLRNFYRREITR